MHEVHAQSWLMDALLMAIILAYVGIATQFWVRRKDTGGRASSALEKLVVIFVFCALCGYLPRLIAVPNLLLVAGHTLLAIAAWAYFFSGSVDRLTVALDYADGDSNTLLARQTAGEEALDIETEACARVLEQAGADTSAISIRERLYQRQQRRKVPAAAS